ncbi:MAG: phosphatidate cytidylyltransferase [Paramuribaculum sp.]|nr:phosphatidate cytidylyltransferase [Paramuribaculum sp.]
MKQLFTRSITGLVYVALIVGSLLFAPAISFPLLAIVLALFAISEFHNLFTSPRKFCATDMTDIAGVIMLITPLTFSPDRQGVVMSLIFGLIWFVVRSALQLRAKAPAVTVFLTSMAGATYIVTPLYIISLMAVFGMANAVIALFIMLGLNDTGANYIGSIMGRHSVW